MYQPTRLSVTRLFIYRITLAVLGLLAITTSAHSAQSTERMVAVSGLGEISAEPDRATVMLGIEARKPQLEATRAQVARGVEGILKLTRELKIDPKWVRTTRLTVQPEYDWNNTAKERRLIGYLVQRQIEIDVRDLEQLGLLLERAVSLGANQVNEPQLDSTKRREFEREALVKAVEDARANAETAARAAGAKVGAVRSISTSASVSPPPPRPEFMMRAQAASNDAQRAETYQAGLLRFTATAEVVYDLIVSGQ